MTWTKYLVAEVFIEKQHDRHSRDFGVSGAFGCIVTTGSIEIDSISDKSLYYTQDKISLQLYKPLIQNQMSDIVTILNVVIKHMTSVESILKLSGDEKKELVINMLEKNMPNYQDYKEIIPVIIELVVVLSRMDIPINIKAIQTCCSVA